MHWHVIYSVLVEITSNLLIPVFINASYKLSITHILIHLGRERHRVNCNAEGTHYSHFIHTFISKSVIANSPLN